MSYSDDAGKTDNPTGRLSFSDAGERAVFLLRELYEQSGYTKYRMGKFEEYDFYNNHKDFLPSGQILTFTDLDGRLMALKPDVTMSIVKRTRAKRESPERLYYNESIYRPARDSREYREIPQIGIEFIGAVTKEIDVEIVSLALKSLACISDTFILDVSHNGFLSGLMENIDAPAEVKREITRLLERKNAHELAILLKSHQIGEEYTARLLALASQDRVALAPQDRQAYALQSARNIAVNAKMHSALDELDDLYASLAGNALRGALHLDFTLAHDSSYYNGLVMRGYIESATGTVLSGGRYDRLLKRMDIKGLEAVGFAIYLDEVAAPVVRRPAAHGASGGEEAGVLKIALPKGRMGNEAYGLFEAAGYKCESYNKDSRKLVFYNMERGIGFLMVKPQDVAVYVERGAADVGVIGKDTLLETGPNVLELADLRFGACRLATAACEGYTENQNAVLRVATKYPNVTRGYYSKQNRDIDIIKLNGSIELAPILGLSDIIVDIVETGGTLKANRLYVRDEIAKSSARLIANVNSYKFKQAEISEMVERLSRLIN